MQHTAANISVFTGCMSERVQTYTEPTRVAPTAGQGAMELVVGNVEIPPLHEQHQVRDKLPKHAPFECDLTMEFFRISYLRMQLACHITSLLHAAPVKVRYPHAANTHSGCALAHIQGQSRLTI